MSINASLQLVKTNTDLLNKKTTCEPKNESMNLLKDGCGPGGCCLSTEPSAITVTCVARLSFLLSLFLFASAVSALKNPSTPPPHPHPRFHQARADYGADFSLANLPGWWHRQPTPQTGRQTDEGAKFFLFFCFFCKFTFSILDLRACFRSVTAKANGCKTCEWKAASTGEKREVFSRGFAFNINTPTSKTKQEVRYELNSQFFLL